ncbi:protein kinase family protein [Peribacillus sp. SCS-155]|uniref:protein kinase family protein n=1 Tax=Peribacillus sedimenti TaxID=3115297 RepID=UPI0039060BBA
MQNYKHLADSVKISSDTGNTALLGFSKQLTLIGQGRSAYVFKIQGSNKVLKVFFPELSYIAHEEAEIYKQLKHLTYFPKFYAEGPNYLVIDFIKGKTLFECLSEGILITDQHIKEIDMALRLAKLEGLNPSDIHLKNIFLTDEGEIKIIDVARFRQTKECYQWNDIKWAFYRWYMRRFFPKKIPVPVLNAISAIYKKKLQSKWHLRAQVVKQK